MVDPSSVSIRFSNYSLLPQISFTGPMMSNYITKITRIPYLAGTDGANSLVDSFIVKKLKFSVNEDGDGFDWATSPDEFKIVIDKKEFASGVTKRAYKVFAFLDQCLHAKFGDSFTSVARHFARKGFIPLVAGVNHQLTKIANTCKRRSFVIILFRMP
jgi:hypothetical protein